MEFRSEKKEKLTSNIVRQIRTAIMQGRFKPGEPLPHEKLLVEQFGVSKHTVREALRALEGLGLITIRRGAHGGPFVSEIDWHTAREFFLSFLHFKKFSLADIFEVRRLIEPHVARCAAKKITPDQIAKLKRLHRRHAESDETSCLIHECDLMFHTLIAQSVNNPFLWTMLDFMNSTLAEFSRNIPPAPNFTKHIHDAHQQLLDALAQRDGDAAARIMTEHLKNVEWQLTFLEQKASAGQE